MRTSNLTVVFGMTPIPIKSKSLTISSRLSFNVFDAVLNFSPKKRSGVGSSVRAFISSVVRQAFDSFVRTVCSQWRVAASHSSVCVSNVCIPPQRDDEYQTTEFKTKTLRIGGFMRVAVCNNDVPLCRSSLNHNEESVFCGKDVGTCDTH